MTQWRPVGPDWFDHYTFGFEIENFVYGFLTEILFDDIYIFWFPDWISMCLYRGSMAVGLG